MCWLKWVTMKMRRMLLVSLWCRPPGDAPTVASLASFGNIATFVNTAILMVISCREGVVDIKHYGSYAGCKFVMSYRNRVSCQKLLPTWYARIESRPTMCSTILTLDKLMACLPSLSVSWHSTTSIAEWAYLIPTSLWGRLLKGILWCIRILVQA